VTRVTERISSPHTLVVIKTHAAYDKRCKIAQEEKATLPCLLTVGPVPPTAAADPTQDATADYYINHTDRTMW
jgi:hypothetical protein